MAVLAELFTALNGLFLKLNPWTVFAVCAAQGQSQWDKLDWLQAVGVTLQEEPRVSITGLLWCGERCHRANL